MPVPPRAPRLWQTIGGNVALAAVYLAAAKVSLAAATEHRVVSSLWPPSGLAVFVLLRYGTQFWPGIAIGAFLLNASSDVTPVGAGMIAIGDMLEAVVAAHLIRRVAGQRRSLTRVEDVFALTFLAGGVATLVAATIGVAALVLSGSTSLAS
ncbi:MAG TPA: MASE1 domain-containing protein, partial [Gemmatimonadaceae bacterium]|nr:MASE1 domain-containing protein [Gemmatimonadaceae bacterium]